MALPSTGQLGAAQIRDEFQGTNPWRISDFYGDGGLVPDGATGSNGPVPETGEIRFSHFRGVADVVTVEFKLWGAGGGGGYNGNGGGGGYVTGTGGFPAGTTFDIIVGGGGNMSNTTPDTAAGGGGRSAVHVGTAPLVTETFTITAGSSGSVVGFSWDDETWDDSEDFGTINDASFRLAVINSIATWPAGGFTFELEKPDSTWKFWPADYFYDIEIVELGLTYLATDAVRDLVSTTFATGSMGTQWLWSGTSPAMVAGQTYTFNIRYRDYNQVEIITAGAGGGGAHYSAHGGAGGGLAAQDGVKTNPSATTPWGGDQNYNSSITGGPWYGGVGLGSDDSKSGGWPNGGDGRVYNGVAGNGGSGSGYQGGNGGQCHPGNPGDAGGGGGSSHTDPSLTSVTNTAGNGRTPGNNSDPDRESSGTGGLPQTIGGNGIVVLYVNGTKYTFYYTGAIQSFTI